MKNNTVEGDNDTKARNKKLVFKNNYPFRSCISKTNNTFVENAKDLDIIMPMHNFLEYSDNYSMTSCSLWNYYRDELNADANENYDANNRIKNNKITTRKSFEYKIKITETTPDENDPLDTKVVVLLKNLSTFWRFLNFSFVIIKRICNIKHINNTWSS